MNAVIENRSGNQEWTITGTRAIMDNYRDTGNNGHKTKGKQFQFRI
jgi:hypothetical protein